MDTQATAESLLQHYNSKLSMKINKSHLKKTQKNARSSSGQAFLFRLYLLLAPAGAVLAHFLGEKERKQQCDQRERALDRAEGQSLRQHMRVVCTHQRNNKDNHGEHEIDEVADRADLAEAGSGRLSFGFGLAF